VTELTVVIATLDRPDTLGQTLDRLERQDSAPEFDVVVASDAAESNLDAVRAAIGERGYPTTHVVAATPGVSTTRNAGWRAASGELILFIGDDMLPGQCLVREHLDWHHTNPDARTAVLGYVRWARQLRTTPFMRWLEQGMQFDYPSIRGREAGWWHFYAANASLKRERLERVGGFDEDFRFGYEELDLAKRIHDQVGLRLLFNRAAEVEHLHPTTIESWKARMGIVARAERQFLAKHPGADPYFVTKFKAVMALTPARGRAARLAAWVPRSTPLLGRKVWESADAYFGQQLAPAFLDAWNEAASGSGAPAAER
jgi:GT2 family glycosyltransferase